MRLNKTSIIIHYLIEPRHHIIERTTDSALAIKKVDHEKRLFPLTMQIGDCRIILNKYGD